MLKSLEIVTCSEVWNKRGILKLLFSETSYTHFLSICLGLGNTEVCASDEKDRKSISTETTFKGTSDKKVLLELCANLCQELSEDMSKKNLVGKVFTVKMKTTKFEVRTRAQTLLEPTRDVGILTAVGRKILTKEMESETSNKNAPLSLRLLGVRMSNFVEKCDSLKQLTLTDLFCKSKNKNDFSDDIEILEVKPRHDQNFENVCQPSTSKNTKNSIEESRDDKSTSKLLRNYIEKAKNNDNLDLKNETSTESVEYLDDKERFTCPVCSSKRFNDISLLNLHVDECLNQDLLKEIAKESSSSSANSGEKRKSAATNTGDRKRIKGPTNVLTKFLGLD